MGPRPRLGDLRPSDRSRVAELLTSTAVFRDEEILVALELVDEALRAFATGSPSAPASTDYVVIGAFTPDDELAGYACYGPTPATDRTWDLYWIAVDPASHGTGIGTLLLREVERRLAALQARLLVVETSSRSEYEPTRRFYAARGYAEAARVRAFYAPGDDRIILTKRIQGALIEGGVAA